MSEYTGAIPASIWGSEIPSRNTYFTGRDTELRTLHERFEIAQAQVLSHPPQAFYGLGGIGKTEIATEYAYRYRSDYHIIWWIRSEKAEFIGDAFARLGSRLGLTAAERDKMISNVREWLCADKDRRWLLIFDNAESPEAVAPFLPREAPPGGHVIITSRFAHWTKATGIPGIEVSEFEEDETVAFLRKRVPQLGAVHDAEDDASRAADAKRLATALGQLPLAAEHAAAYLAEMGISVQQYLDEFQQDPHGVMSRPHDTRYGPVAATWSMSVRRLSRDAREIFQLAAFFSPEPIARELLIAGADDITGLPELRDALASDHRCQAALYELHRLSLVKLDGRRSEVRMHRVVQAVTRSQVEIDRAENVADYRAAVHALLAASDPRAPERNDNDGIYDRSLQHLNPDDVVATQNPGLRRLIANQVRRLHLRGRHREALQLGERALSAWQEAHGESDVWALRLATELGIARRLAERFEEAYTLNQRTLELAERLQETGETEEVRAEARQIWLICANSHGGDLRPRGRFTEALDLDLELLPRFEREFLPSHERTLNVRNNIGADYRRLGDFQKALEYDEVTLAERIRLLGEPNTRTLASKSALARDLRGVGDYHMSYNLARSIIDILDQKGVGRSPDSLNARMGFAVALRKAGYYDDAVRTSQDVYDDYVDYLGPHHRYTLSAAANRIADLRVTGNLGEAKKLGTEALDACRVKDTPERNITFAVQVNLAAVLRQLGDPVTARKEDEEALRGLTEVYGDRHPFTLVAAANLANDLHACGRPQDARELNEKTLALGRDVRPDNHPDTLATAANLSHAMRTLGEAAAAEELLADTLARYAERLTEQHPEARTAARFQPISLELEPY